VGAERYTSAVAARLAAGPAQVGVRASGQPGAPSARSRSRRRCGTRPA